MSSMIFSGIPYIIMCISLNMYARFDLSTNVDQPQIPLAQAIYCYL